MKLDQLTEKLDQFEESLKEFCEDREREARVEDFIKALTEELKILNCFYNWEDDGSVN